MTPEQLQQIIESSITRALTEAHAKNFDMWQDIKTGQNKMANDVIDIKVDLRDVKTQLAEVKENLKNIDRRVEKLEEWQGDLEVRIAKEGSLLQQIAGKERREGDEKLRLSLGMKLILITAGTTICVNILSDLWRLWLK